jgi:UDP-2,3-diacylglucosamine hydrolase
VSERLFIADLHLDPSRPHATTAFLRFLERRARDAGRLYILGDLFEFWIGDDDDEPHAREVLDALHRYTAGGHQCLLMRGNRDFLFGRGIERRTGGHLLDDPTVEEIFGERVVLMHGDLLCTDDHAYHRYRRIVTNPLMHGLFLALPRSLRRAAGAVGRRRSRSYTASLRPSLMDVNAQTVTETLARHEATILLHGHTHRPGIHELQVGDRRARRIVLGDWYEQGSVLRWSAAGFALESLPFG